MIWPLWCIWCGSKVLWGQPVWLCPTCVVADPLADVKHPLRVETRAATV